MKKILLLLAFVATVSITSCTSYTCPTYSLENTQELPTQLVQQDL